MSDIERDLLELKKTDEAPSFLQLEGYKTLLAGYLLPNETPRDMYSRLAKAAASHYKDASKWEKKFFNAMWNNWLCAASPVLSNLGSKRGLPISCNSIHLDDSVHSIFMKNHELAMLSKNGAGVGIYMGDIRSRGKNINGNGQSEGVIPWCKTLDSTTVAVSQGCYDKDTEILTERGWLKFSELKQGTKVAQSDEKGNVNFVDFTDYIEYYVEEDLYRFNNKTSSVDLLVTGNHRMALEYRKRISDKRDKNGKFLCNDKRLTNSLRIIEADKVNLHRDNRFWVAARNVAGRKETLSPLEQFFIAYQADGSTNPTGNSTGEISDTLIYTFHFSKKRKIDRLKIILNKLNWHFTENQQNDGTTNILVRVPLNIKLSKKLQDMFDITTFSISFAREFINELSNWDGSLRDNNGVSYSCVIEDNVNFVQAVAFLAGKMSSIGVLNKKEGHHQLRHFIYICDRDSVGGEEADKTKQFYAGNVYCITVPTGLLVVRRNGAVIICGNSTRRGASAVYLPIDHGDIEEFLNIRRPTGDINRRCLNLNHGVCITDDWMKSMISGDQKKRIIWGELLKNRVEGGEPYLFFTDNVNKVNPQCYKENGLSVKTSNICSEIFLHTDPDHSFVCCLSSLNLTKWEEWKDTDTVEVGIRFLDAVLEEYIQKSEGVPGLEASRRSAIKGRAVGLGVLGWHTLLQQKMIPFDSFDAMTLNNEIFRLMRRKSDEETKRLAEELGEPEWCKGFGRRNTHCLACAPTVSNSIISGGHSAGIEPLSANLYSQKSAKGTFIRKNPILEKLLDTLKQNTIETWRSINEQSGSVQHLSFLSKEEKEVFLTAREINQHAIIKQAAQRQKWIDQGQSVNLFFASNSKAKYIHEVHLAAWELGLKSLYYLRTEGVIKGDMASRSKEECTACEG
jgi:ribonucleoside-diphosphate reductase alpha chain